MRLLNLLLIVPILASADCGGRSGLDGIVANIGGEQSFGGATATGGMIVTGGTYSTGGGSTAGGPWNTGGCLSYIGACNVGSFVGPGAPDCPQGAVCHTETQYQECGIQVRCAVYSNDAGADGNAGSGGTPSTSVDAGSGCTGSFETVQSDTGLCVARMATITGPEGDAGTRDAGSSDYQIDVTEVTKGQYDAWLATSPALPEGTDANCSYVSSYAEQCTGYTGADADHHPVVCVDWCDAYAYCAGVGKRLCGAIGGGSDPIGSSEEANSSQWYRACSSAGANLYPYGNTYQSSYCNGLDYWNGSLSTMQTVAVGSLRECVTSTKGYAGVHDLSGNVWEWVDSCSATGQLAPCYFRGGAFDDINSTVLPCYSVFSYNRNDPSVFVGFRCCSQ